MDTISVTFTPDFERALHEFKVRHWPILEKALAHPEIYAAFKSQFDAYESGELCLFDFKQVTAPSASNVVLTGVFTVDYLDFFTTVRARVDALH